MSTGAQGQVSMQIAWCCWESWCIALFSWCYLLWSWTIYCGSLVHWLKNIPKALGSHHHVWRWGTVFLGLKASPFLCQMKATSLWPNNYIFVSSDHKTEDQKSASLSRWALTKAKRAFVCLIWRSGVLLGLRPWNRAVCIVCWTICLDMLTSAVHISTRKALVVILGFFFSSLTSSWPAQVSLLASGHVLWDFPQCGTSCIFFF